MRHSAWILTAAAVWAASAAPAQELGLSDMYGRGVHAYFSGQSRAAYEYLTAAINAGSQDPRSYYFRGLAYQRLGRPTEARADFQRGAELEHQDAGGVFGVDRALERVQGPARLTIERYRAAARVGAAQEVLLERNRRTITARAATPEVSAPGEQILGEVPADFNSLPPAGATPPVKGEVDQPFGEPANPNAPATPAPPMPAQPNPLNETPFGEPAVPPKPATPSTPPAASETEGQGGSARALGNVLKRAFGGFMPSLPEVPSGLPLGSGDSSPPQQDDGQAPANPPATPGANANENHFDAPATPPAKPAPATNENPFDT